MSKFCINCAHMKETGRGKFANRVCAHPALRGEPDPVYGHRSHASMRDERAESGRCGPDGKLYEAAPPKRSGFLPW